MVILVEINVIFFLKLCKKVSIYWENHVAEHLLISDRHTR